MDEHELDILLEFENYVCRDKEALPQRDTTIYKDIENFKSYELTYCIAYEMAIRNPIISQKIENYLKNRHVINSSDEEYQELTTFGFSHKSLIYYHNCKIGMQKLLEKLDNKKLRVKYSQNDLIWKDELVKEKSLGNNTFEIYREFTPNLLSTSYGLFTINGDSISEVQKENISMGSVPDIELEFARPKLKFQESKLFKVELNLNLTPSEQGTYIEKILEEYQKNSSLFKTFMDYFRDEELLRQENKISRYIADAFYVYDYITFRKKDGQKYNRQVEQEYEEKVNLIKKDSSYTYDEKEEQIKELGKELKQNKLQLGHTNIAKDEEITTQLKLSSKRIAAYYSEIRPYIDNMKYKELITGFQL